jgi:ribosomal protein S18 acetylase RimI-like enzyme
MDNSVSLRPATADDAAFLELVYKSSRGDDLRGLGWDENRIGDFLSMQYEAQRAFDGQDHGKAMDQVILYDDKPVGRLLVESREQEIRCLDLAVLPDFRNRGVGTHLLRTLQTQATNSHRSLRLQVIRFNRALTLLERLGFVRTSETGTHFQMEWKPPGMPI